MARQMEPGSKRKTMRTKKTGILTKVSTSGVFQVVCVVCGH